MQDENPNDWIDEDMPVDPVFMDAIRDISELHRYVKMSLKIDLITKFHITKVLKTSVRRVLGVHTAEAHPTGAEEWTQQHRTQTSENRA